MKKKIIIIAVILVLVIAAVYYYYTRKPKTEEEILTPVITPGPNNNLLVSNDTFPLKIGSKGENVTYLQKALNKLGATIEVDGNFGQQTYSAILLKVNATSYPVTLDVFNTIMKKSNNTI